MLAGVIMCLFPVEEFHSMVDGMVQLLLVVGAGLDYTPSNNNSLPITETIEPWTTNSCIWTTCSPSDDGESLYLYYGYGVGIRCYELTKYEK